MYYHVYYAYNVNKELYTLDKEHNSQQGISQEISREKDHPPLFFWTSRWELCFRTLIDGFDLFLSNGIKRCLVLRFLRVFYRPMTF